MKTDGVCFLSNHQIHRTALDFSRFKYANIPDRVRRTLSITTNLTIRAAKILADKRMPDWVNETISNIYPVGASIISEELILPLLIKNSG